MTPHPRLIKRTRTHQHPLPVSEVKILHQARYHRVTSFVPVSSLRQQSLLRIVVGSPIPASTTLTTAPAPAQQCDGTRGAPSPSNHGTGFQQLQHRRTFAQISRGGKVIPVWTRWTNTVTGPRHRPRRWAGPAAEVCLQITQGGRWAAQTPRFPSG